MRFVHEANIARFIHLLEREPDMETQGLLRRLLVEEEDRLGHNLARFDIMDRHIGRTIFLIAQHRLRLEQMRANGQNVTEGERLLENMLNIQSLLVRTRDSWAKLPPFNL